MAPRLLPTEKDDEELKELNARRMQPGFLPDWGNSNSGIAGETFNTEAAMIPPPPSNTPWSLSMPSWNTNLSSMRNQSMGYNVPEGYNSNLATKPRSVNSGSYNQNRNFSYPSPRQYQKTKYETDYDRWLQSNFMQGTDSTGSFAHGQDNSLSMPERFMKDRYSPQSTMHETIADKQLFKGNIPGPREMSKYGGADKTSLYGKLWQGIQLAPELWSAYNQSLQADAMKAQVANTGRAIDNKQAQWHTTNLQNIATWNDNQNRRKRVILGRRPGDTVEEQNKATAHLTYL